MAMNTGTCWLPNQMMARRIREITGVDRMVTRSGLMKQEEGAVKSCRNADKHGQYHGDDKACQTAEDSDAE